MTRADHKADAAPQRVFVEPREQRLDLPRSLQQKSRLQQLASSVWGLRFSSLCLRPIVLLSHLIGPQSRHKVCVALAGIDSGGCLSHGSRRVCARVSGSATLLRYIAVLTHQRL